MSVTRDGPPWRPYAAAMPPQSPHPPVTIAPYVSADAAPTRTVFRRAIAVTARAHYRPDQIAAWLARDSDLTAWDAARRATHTLVARRDDVVVGFTGISPSGYVDMLFVTPEAGRSGVGGALLSAVRDHAAAEGIRRLTVHASLTARTVFERHGFVVIERCFPTIDGVTFTNFLMASPE